MATVYEQNLANLSKDLGINSILAPQLSSNPFSNIFGGQDPSSLLSTSLGIPEGVGLSQESSTPIGNRSAQNSTQSAQKEQSNLQKAFEGVQSLYDPTGGRPIAGSEDVRVKVDAYGRPFTVVNISPRTGTDIYGSKYTMQGQNKVYDGPTDDQKQTAARTAQGIENAKASGIKMPEGELARREKMVIQQLGQTGKVNQTNNNNLLSKYLQ